MTRRATIDHDALKAAYLETGSLLRAAQVLGLSDKTVERHRKNDPDLDRMLTEVRDQVAERRAAERRANRKPHGTRARYKDCTDGPDGGKCAKCRAANTEAQRKGKANRRTYRPLDIPHGVGGYRNYGCRCNVCTRAAAEDIAAYRRRKNEEAA